MWPPNATAKICEMNPTPTYSGHATDQNTTGAAIVHLPSLSPNTNGAVRRLRTRSPVTSLRSWTCIVQKITVEIRIIQYRPAEWIKCSGPEAMRREPLW